MPSSTGKYAKVTIEGSDGTKTVLGAIGNLKITPLARDSGNLAISFIAYPGLNIERSMTSAEQPKFTADDELNTAPKSWWTKQNQELMEIEVREKKQKEEARAQVVLDRLFGARPKRITLLTPDNRFVQVDADDPSLNFWIKNLGYKVYEEVKDSISLAPFPGFELSIRGADMRILKEFGKARKAGTPWALFQTADYRVLGRDVMEYVQSINGDKPLPIVAWDCVRGHYGFNEPDGMSAARTFGDAQETVSAPAAFLSKALENLPANGIVLMVFPSNEMLQEPLVAQAIANLRDPFKSDGRTLVMIGNFGLEAPPLVKSDIPIFVEDMPGRDRIVETIVRLSKDAKGELPKEQIEGAVPLCLGLAPFMIEEGISHNLRKKKDNGGILDLDLKGLAELQRNMIEQSTSGGLMFERESLTFDDMGGNRQFALYMKKLFTGPRPPSLIVRWDEADKSVTSASTGTVADNTGTAQDQLRCFLTSMQDNKWRGCILAGCPGSGKTLATICAGNTFGKRTLVIDMGAAKASLLGESERKIRLLMGVLKAVGGNDVFFMATVNRTDTLPPEFQARFNRGTWYFAPPNENERQSIWEIQAKRSELELKKHKLPNAEGWVGRDIRNCCEQAKELGCSLKEASEMIVVASKTSAKDIARLEILAEEGGWLSANYPGSYQREEKKSKVERRMAL